MKNNKPKGDNVINVGRYAGARYVAFGDESRFRDRLVYATIIVHRTDLDYFREVLSRVKVKYAIPNSEELHCRVLFNSNQRDKRGLSHLTDEIVRAMLLELVSDLVARPILCRFTHAIFSQNPEFLEAGTWEDSSGNPGPMMNAIPNEPKGILGLLMQATFCCPLDGSEGPPISEIEVFVSEDKTKVEFLQKKQAHNFCFGYSDVNAPPGMVWYLNPHVVKSNGMPLLQVADICAYAASHMELPINETEYWGSIITRMSYVSKIFNVGNSIA